MDKIQTHSDCGAILRRAPVSNCIDILFQNVKSRMIQYIAYFVISSMMFRIQITQLRTGITGQYNTVFQTGWTRKIRACRLRKVPIYEVRARKRFFARTF